MLQEKKCSAIIPPHLIYIALTSIKWKRQSLKIGAYLLLRRIENEKVKFIYQERPCTFLRTDSAEFVTTANSSHVSPWPMNWRLWLLRSRPDQIHVIHLHGTWLSTPLMAILTQLVSPQKRIQPRYSGFRVQGTANTPPSTAIFIPDFTATNEYPNFKEQLPYGHCKRPIWYVNSFPQKKKSENYFHL